MVHLKRRRRKSCKASRKFEIAFVSGTMSFRITACHHPPSFADFRDVNRSDSVRTVAGADLHFSSSPHTCYDAVHVLEMIMTLGAKAG